MKQVRNFGVYLGCDPEFFFKIKDRIMGCERFLPTNGVRVEGISEDGEVLEMYRSGELGKLIIDGVQAEMNPQADTCRELLSYKIGYHFRKVKDILAKHKDSSISIDPCVPVAPEELGDLSDKAKFFGCTPSKNIYDEKNVMPIKDSSKYYFRSAGGHVHLGYASDIVSDVQKNAKDYVRMLDIIVGNTCVLLDRHEGNVERRKVYGRAGEYRLPKHGIEYRTPSNFWLRNYQLMSFVFGLSRIASNIMQSSNREQSEYIGNGEYNKFILPDFAKMIFDAVDQEEIRRAINDNDFDLAMSNFMKIKPIIDKIIPVDGKTPINGNNTGNLLAFIKNGGIEHYFKDDVLEHWVGVTHGEQRGNGWENFIQRINA